MSDPVHECARCKSPVKSEEVVGPDFTYWWFECKKCKLKWAALKPIVRQGAAGGKPRD